MKILLQIFTALLLSISDQDNSTLLLNSSIMKSEDQWRIVNDGVMGGLSSSKVSINEEEILFSGKVSLENNGGFASLRSPIKNYNFENYSGLEIRIKGDGKIYSFSMKETSYFTGSFYTANFQTTKDEWLILKIPFSSFAQSYFGREVRSNPKIPLNKIKEVSLLIGEKQVGTFKAEIDYIKLY